MGLAHWAQVLAHGEQARLVDIAVRSVETNDAVVDLLGELAWRLG